MRLYVLLATHLMRINNGAETVGSSEIGALPSKWAGIANTNFDNFGMVDDLGGI